jgi:hypothetical protein
MTNEQKLAALEAELEWRRHQPAGLSHEQQVQVLEFIIADYRRLVDAAAAKLEGEEPAGGKP